LPHVLGTYRYVYVCYVELWACLEQTGKVTLFQIESFLMRKSVWSTFDAVNFAST